MSASEHEQKSESGIISLTDLGKGSWLVLKIMGPLFIGAFLVAGFCMWKLNLSAGTALIFIGVSFVLMAFIAIPLWLATIEDELHDADH